MNIINKGAKMKKSAESPATAHALDHYHQ